MFNTFLARTHSRKEKSKSCLIACQISGMRMSSARHAWIAGLCVLAVVCLIVLPQPSWGFCGFYVAKADAKLFNKASQVAIVRDGNRTVMTMSNDFEGEVRDFATVIPVPTKITKEQIHIGERKLIDHLDAYTAPRLVEYHDPDPCRRMYKSKMRSMRGAAPPMAPSAMAEDSAQRLGVTIEAKYTVGEYDILILSAKQSDGLQTWLSQEGYKIPPKARKILGSYIKQKMKFFVAKVNLKEMAKREANGDSPFLRPIQVAYESNKFMLPIRLGTVNSNGPQDAIVYVLTKKGRVESTNYRTIKLPSDMDVPLYIKDDFAHFYKDMFKHQAEKENMKAVFLEYAWNMGWCDPCAADPLSQKELADLGVWWVNGSENNSSGGGPTPMVRRGRGRKILPPGPRPRPTPRPMPAPRGGPQQVYVTRLHVRYTADSFPADIRFQETSDTSNFQGRYVLRHPFKGEMSCDAAAAYKQQVNDRQQKAASQLANLTGWDINEIRKKDPAIFGTKAKAIAKDPKKKWWNSLWR